MYVLISIFFVTQVIQVFGKLTVLRELSSFGTKLTCISEDDGSALVWNYRFRDETYLFELDSRTERKLNKDRRFIRLVNSCTDSIQSFFFHPRRATKSLLDSITAYLAH